MLMTKDEITREQVLLSLMLRLWQEHKKTEYAAGMYCIILPGQTFFCFGRQEMQALKKLFISCSVYLSPAYTEIIADYERLTKLATKKNGQI